MKPLPWLRHKLNKELAKGKDASPLIIKQLQADIREAEKKRGKRPRRKL